MERLWALVRDGAWEICRSLETPSKGTVALPCSLLLPGHEISSLVLPNTPSLQRAKVTCPHEQRLDSLELQVIERLTAFLCVQARGQPQVTYLRYQSSCFPRQGPSLAWSSLISPDWLASEPQRFISVSSVVGFQWCATMPGFLNLRSWDWTQVLMLAWPVFDWAAFPLCD